MHKPKAYKTPIKYWLVIVASVRKINKKTSMEYKPHTRYCTSYFTFCISFNLDSEPVVNTLPSLEMRGRLYKRLRINQSHSVHK